MNRPRVARGFMLIAVLIVVTIAGGLLSWLAWEVSRSYAELATARMDAAARSLARAGAAYAESQSEAWSASPPAAAVQLDVNDLLPPGVIGSVDIRCAAADCDIQATVARAARQVTVDAHVSLK